MRCLATACILFTALSAEAAVVTKTIGTDSRDYSTITLWEADLDDSGIYSSGDTAVGEVYNDSAFDEDVFVDGGGTIGLVYITLTVASGERHDGTAGTGARIVKTGGSETPTLDMRSPDIDTTLEWLEIDGGGGSRKGGITFQKGSGGTATTHYTMRLIVHDYSGVKPRYGIENLNRSNLAADSFNVLNTIVYDITLTSNNPISGIMGFNSSDADVFINNTVYNVLLNHTGSQDVFGIRSGDDTQDVTKNNISVGTGGTNSGLQSDFTFSGTSVVSENNLSEDDTSDDGLGSNHVTGATLSTIFVSTTGGSEDLHLQDADSPAVDAGLDLGTTPTGVNFDIDNRDRDAEGDTWDMGADEFVAEGGAPPVPRRRTIRIGSF